MFTSVQFAENRWPQRFGRTEELKARERLEGDGQGPKECDSPCLDLKREFDTRTVSTHVFYGPDRNGVVDACAIPSYIGCRTKSVFKTKPWKSTVALLLLMSSLREDRFRLTKAPYLIRS